jgi:GT2 family glycosyltransferase
MIIRKDVWTSLDGFDPLFFVYSEESDFCWRVWLSGFRVVFAPAAIVYHVGAGTTTKFKPYFFMFQHYRNQIVTVIKNLSLESLIKYAPGIVGLRLILVVLHIRRNEPMAVLGNMRGFFWCLLFFNQIWAKRTNVQSRRVVNDKDLFERGIITRRGWL